MSDADAALDLVTELCTTEQIHALLAGARGQEGVRLTARNKAEIVENLRVALGKNAIGLDKVFALIQEGEENGSQHIFYFRAAARALRERLRFEDVKAALALPRSVRDSLPRLDLVPEGYSLADFRSLAPRKPNDWVLKFYKDETREYFTGRIVQEDGTRFLKEFDTKRFRHILLIRFNFPDLLEFRIPRDTSKERMTAWLAYLASEFKPVASMTELREWDLSTARANLIQGESTQGDRYHLRDTQVETPDHDRATFEPYAPGAGLFAKEYMRAAVGDLLDAKSKCVRLNVTWLPRKADDIEREIRTTIGSTKTHEVIVGGHQTSREIDYVTEQLRAFSS